MSVFEDGTAVEGRTDFALRYRRWRRVCTCLVYRSLFQAA